MTENFNSSECDDLFDSNSIKTPYSGAYFKEINDSINRAIIYNKDLDMIISSLDILHFKYKKDDMRYESYPTYLYDDYLFNDFQYIYNLDFFCGDLSTLAILPTVENCTPTSFDNYSNWTEDAIFDSLILQLMSKGEYQLTKDNYKQHFEEITDFYTNYNYDSLFENK